MLVHIFKVFRFVLRFIKTQNQFNERYIDSYLQPFYLQYHKQLKASTLVKIKKYYCLALPMTCASYAKIYNRALTEKESVYAVLAGILIPLLDDFTDEKTLSNADLDQLTTFPADYRPQTLEEAIVKTIICYLLENVKKPEDCINLLRQIIQAQHWSQRQTDADVSREELLNISLEKGGHSLVLFHFLLDEEPNRQTIDTLYLMGGILQICNDIFDLYKDYQEGIATYANTCDDFNVLIAFYTNKCRQFVKEARKLPYSSNNIEFFITFFVIVMARGAVALRRLRKLQIQLGGGVLPISQLDRKQLICDMEKPMNFLKTAWFTYNILLK
ncbi:MAG: hypothetical protein EAZ07_07960 [Cytophagales bacterium]|nr:MAG: hypothetical protein EAZ07_07960 [Cytophagales bacterium]